MFIQQTDIRVAATNASTLHQTTLHHVKSVKDKFVFADLLAHYATTKWNVKSQFSSAPPSQQHIPSWRTKSKKKGKQQEINPIKGVEELPTDVASTGLRSAMCEELKEDADIGVRIKSSSSFKEKIEPFECLSNNTRHCWATNINLVATKLT